LSLGFLSPGFLSQCVLSSSSGVFLLKVLENQGNPSTNHLFHASTPGVHGLPGTNLEISKKA
jgi:hypothetical protein